MKGNNDSSGRSPAPSPSSWIGVAQGSDFPLSNLPFGVCSLTTNKGQRDDVTSTAKSRCVTIVGSTIVDLQVLQEAGLFDDIDQLAAHSFSEPSLDDFVSHPHHVWSQVRQRLTSLLSADGDDALHTNEGLKSIALLSETDVVMGLPLKISSLAGYYSSRSQFAQLASGSDTADGKGQSGGTEMPNAPSLPIGYNAKASSVFATGTSINRPNLSSGGQASNVGAPTDLKVEASKALDFEAKLAFVVGGPPNAAGKSEAAAEAQQRVFGYCLVNDWTARDVQASEAIPFESKNFATTMSPWIVTSEALQPLAPSPPSESADTSPATVDFHNIQGASPAITIDVRIQPKVPSSNKQPLSVEPVCTPVFGPDCWSAAQLLTHHFWAGSVVKPGDIFMMSAQSQSDPKLSSSLWELTDGGKHEVDIGSDQTRKFLQDRDTVVMKGWCSHSANPSVGRIGFGPCTSTVLPPDPPEPTKSPSSGDNPPMATPSSGFHSFKLYGYATSSSTWRVRVVLEAKRITFENIPLNLQAGEHKTPEFLAKNPHGQVPVLEYTHTDGDSSQTRYISQSVAIIEFLDSIFPNKRSLIPRDPIDYIAAREMVEIVNAGIQPLQNKMVVANLEKLSEGKIVGKEYGNMVIAKGLRSFETLVKARQATNPGPFSLGTFAPTIADAYLIPQLFNAANVYGIDVISDFPVLAQVEEACSKHPWFIAAHPSQQPDAPRT